MDTPAKCAIGAIVRGAYERALEADARACKRSAEGLSPEEGIEPLKKEVDEDLQVLFRAPKIVVPPSSRIGSDVLIAIFNGQFKRSVPEFFDIMQTETRALARSKPTKAAKKSIDGITISLPDDPFLDVEGLLSCLYTLIQRLDLLLVTITCAGSFTVTINGIERLYTEAAEIQEYKDAI